MNSPIETPEMTRTTALLVLAAPLFAQDPLSLHDAVHLALGQNKAIAASNAGVKASDARMAETRAGLLPKVTIPSPSCVATTPSSFSAHF